MQDRKLVMKLGWGILIVFILSGVGIGMWLFGGKKKEEPPKEEKKEEKINYNHCAVF